MFDSEKKSPLDRLRKGLYSRNSAESEPRRHEMHAEHIDVPDSWDEEEKEKNSSDPAAPGAPRHRRIYRIVFASSAVFLALALAIAAYTFLSGGNFVSVDNVDILIEGPATIAGGDTLSLDATVSNKNQTPIQLVDLVVEYPQGTKDPSDPSRDLTQVRESLGDINSQSIAQKTLSSVIFGQEGNVKDIKFTVEYRTADSNAIFSKEKVYHVTVSSSPVIVTVDAPEKVIAGTSFGVTITVTSNATQLVKNLLLSLDYPFGFSAVSADPAATYSDNIWKIGDLAPGAKRVIKLQATVTGDDGANKTVHANVGIEDPASERDIGTTIVTEDYTLTIERPFLGIDLTLDGNHGDLAAQPGHAVRSDILWVNNSASQISSARIVAKLSGSVLDRNSITVDNGGYYDSLANTITWDAGRSPGLDTIAPGANGRVGFIVASVQAAPGQAILNPSISIAVSAQGNRTDETGAPQSVNTAVTRSIKVVSNLALSAHAIYSQGPFKNTGPIPPRVDQTTTYTVIWTVTNTSNTITGAKATAVLPQYVKWVGAVNPSDANISYDPKSGTVEWDIGDVPQNADIGTGAKQVSFQISFTPSANQVGVAADLEGQASLTGNDVFTGATLKNSASSLSTRITTDLLYKNGDEAVQQ